MDKNEWYLTAILNTHSNADHIGGNKYLQGQTGGKIYSGGIEAAFTKYPVLEPSFLYGGYPCKDLRHKFLMAQESNVTDFSDENFPKEIEVIPLPGHFFDMVGSTVRSYLSWLKGTGKLEVIFQDSMMLWKRRW